ncbi:MAG: hypothetical protein SFX72_22880 [Isosphaeraceae bacterium]|nr:hypothetical protein [Isosphaeraceae bacterium]
MPRLSTLFPIGLGFALISAPACGEELAKLPLKGDAREHIGKSFAVDVEGVAIQSEGARFDALERAIRLTPRDDAGRELGRGDFTLALTLDLPANAGPITGDLIGRFDPARRAGFLLSLESGAGATNSQSNLHQLQFGIDAGTEPRLIDIGRPGKAVYVMGLVAHAGSLYAATCEPGDTEAGRVYRHDGGERWVDLGPLDAANAVTALAVHQGRLIAGTGRYRLAGSSLPESRNPNLGGRLFQLDPDRGWTEIGALPGVEAVGGLLSFQGTLYASSLYRPAGFFRYEGERRWVAETLPADGRRVVALGVHRGRIHAGSYDACAVYRREGDRWLPLGELEASGQTYSFETHEGRLHVGTWPNGRVFRLEPDGRFASAGRLGAELEVMGLAMHNGKLYGGTLPLAEIHRFESGERWTRIGRVDTTPDVKYRRAWATATYQGRLCFGTLPSGRVVALEAGKAISDDHELAPGRRRILARRRGGDLALFVDGRRVARVESPEIARLDLRNDRPVEIGSGPIGPISGTISDVSIFDHALDDDAVAADARAFATR